MCINFAAVIIWILFSFLTADAKPNGSISNALEASGAGDIFASAFFVRLNQTRDPWEAARFATNLAAYSVTRVGLNGIPTREEIERCLMEVLL